jgi:nitrile hydratase subunit beta
VNGAHDLGGMMGFGRVEPDPRGPCFHAEWERRAFGLAMAMQTTRAFTLDAARHARERLHPAVYLASSYYEIWARALEELVVELQLATRDELRAGAVVAPPAPVPRTVGREEAEALVAHGTPFERPPARPARHAAGDRVVTRNMHPAGHTRLPRYARGRRGVVEHVHGVFVLPDAAAHGCGEQPEWLYTVRFTGRELWGEDADPALEVSIAAWESYLEPDPVQAAA